MLPKNEVKQCIDCKKNHSGMKEIKLKCIKLLFYVCDECATNCPSCKCIIHKSQINSYRYCPDCCK